MSSIDGSNERLRFALAEWPPHGSSLSSEVVAAGREAARSLVADMMEARDEAVDERLTAMTAAAVAVAVGQL